MALRPRGNTLQRWEVALVKVMLSRGGYNDQEILSYFTRPTRSINHRVISEIRGERKHRVIKPATANELDRFLATWPDIDPGTGLSFRGDELLVKAREAMIAAVHTFNSAGLHFRAELFIVTAIIAWTYLLHAYYRGEKVDYRYYHNVDGVRRVAETEQGAEKYWELGKCLRSDHCPLDETVRKNLEFLLELRHEIEHRSTNRIDDAIGAALQSCCLNFNDAIRNLFGQQFGLEKRLPMALQFVTFDAEQRAALKAADLPEHISTQMTEFLDGMTDDELLDPRFSFRVAFVPKVANRASAADMSIEFVKPGSEEADEINKIFIKDGERLKYKPGQVVAAMQEGGFPEFKMHHHSELWNTLDARDPAKGFGVQMLDGQWYWYQSWVARVKAHCEEHADNYR